MLLYKTTTSLEGTGSGRPFPIVGDTLPPGSRINRLYPDGRINSLGDGETDLHTTLADIAIQQILGERDIFSASIGQLTQVAYGYGPLSSEDKQAFIDALNQDPRATHVGKGQYVLRAASLEVTPVRDEAAQQQSDLSCSPVVSDEFEKFLRSAQIEGRAKRRSGYRNPRSHRKR